MEKSEERTAERMLQEEKLYTDGIIIDEPGLLERSFMLKEYRQTGRLISSIIRDSEAVKSSKLSDQKVNNVVSFVGSRGTGKTSVMLSVLNFFKKENLTDSVRSLFSFDGSKNLLDDITFVNLQYIDASVLKASEDVMSIILARMFRHLRELTESSYGCGSSLLDQEETRNLFRKFERVYQSVMTLNDERPLLEGESALRRLQSLNSSFSLADSFRELVDSFLKCVVQCRGCSGQKAYLVIALDDVDRYMPSYQKNVYTLLGQIDEYLKIPGIIILMTYDEELLKHNCHCHIEKKFELIRESEITVAQVEQYLTKIIPNREKIYMPNLGWEDRSSASRLQIVLNQENRLFPDCQVRMLPAKELTFCYLAEYYGCYFDAMGQKKHFFEEQNLRRLTDLVLALTLTPQEKEEDNGYSKLMSYVYNPFKNFFLNGEEAHLFDGWMEKTIDHRSRDILEYIRLKRGDELFSSKRKREDSWGYSYGELLYNLYRSSREDDRDRDQPIFSKGMVKCILASYSVVLPHLVREKNDKNNELIKKVLGTSVGGHWTNAILPTVFTYQMGTSDGADEEEMSQPAYEQVGLFNKISDNEKGMKAFARGQVGALNVKGNLNSIIHITTDNHVLSKGQEIDERTFIQAVELMGMFFTNIQSGGNVHDYDLVYNPADDILTTAADSACFNILNFVVNSFSWEEYFSKLHQSLVNVLMCRRCKLPFTQLLSKQDQKEFASLRRAIWRSVAKNSLKARYEKWAGSCGGCVLPFQHFDMMYNIMKRQQDDRPHGLKAEAEPKDFLECCRTVYKNLREALKEQDDFYGKCLSVNRVKFERIFEECPFIQYVNSEAYSATQLLEDWTTQMVKNMTLSVSTVRRSLLEKR